MMLANRQYLVAEKRWKGTAVERAGYVLLSLFSLRAEIATLIAGGDRRGSGRMVRKPSLTRLGKSRPSSTRNRRTALVLQPCWPRSTSVSRGPPEIASSGEDAITAATFRPALFSRAASRGSVCRLRRIWRCKKPEQTVVLRALLHRREEHRYPQCKRWCVSQQYPCAPVGSR